MRIKDSKPVSFITKIFRRKVPNKFKKKNSAIGKTQEGWANSRETVRSVLSRTSSNKSGSSSSSNAGSSSNARRSSNAGGSINADGSSNVGGSSNARGSNNAGGSCNAGGSNNAQGSNNVGGSCNAGGNSNARDSSNAGDSCNAGGSIAARDSSNAGGSNNAGGVGGGGGTFLEFMRLRKKILLFREIFDIPALNGSVAIHELVTATIEDLNNMYPDLIPGNPILKMKERNTHQGLICLYHVLDCIADSWVEDKSTRDKFKFKKPHIETSPLDELVELVLEILDCINNAAKERFELMDVELKHECSSSIKVKPKPKPTTDYNSEYSRSPASLSPHTPTSVFPDSPRVADLLGAMLGSYSSPQLLNLRVHAVEKLSPFDLKRLVVQVMPQFASNDNFHQNRKPASIEEANLEAKDQATIELKGRVVDNDVRDKIDRDGKTEEEKMVQEDDEEKEMEKATSAETEEAVENVQPPPLPSPTSPSTPDILPENAISTPSSPLTLIVSPQPSTPLDKSSPTSPNCTKIPSPPSPPPQMPATASSIHLPPPPPSPCYSPPRTHTPQPQPLGISFPPLPPPPPPPPPVPRAAPPPPPPVRDNGEHLPPPPVSGAAPPPPPPVPSVTPPSPRPALDNGGHPPPLPVPSAAPPPPPPVMDNGGHPQPPPVVIAAPPPPPLVMDNEGHPPPPPPPPVRRVPSPPPPPVTDNGGHPPPPPVPSAAPPPPPVTDNGGHSSPPAVLDAAPPLPPPVTDNGGHPPPPPPVPGAIPPPPQLVTVNGGHPPPPPGPGAVPPPLPPLTDNGGHPPPPGPMMKGDAAPPPPGGMRTIVRPRNRSKLKRSTHMGNLYRILRGKVEGSCLPEGKPSQANKNVTNGGNAGGGTSMADALAEMTKRSAYFQQIEGDMAKHGSAIKELQRDLTAFKTSDMDELLKFHLRVESLLELLTDETQILSRFENFPMKKLETLRMAAALFMKLNGIVLEIQNWKPKSPLAENLDKLEKYFNKIKSELEGLERTKDEESKKFQSQNIYFDFSILTKIKESMVDLSSGFIELALKERGEAKAKTNDKTDGTHMLSVKMLWRAFQFAFKVYSFAGGQDERADSLTRELAKEIETDPMQE